MIEEIGDVWMIGPRYRFIKQIDGGTYGVVALGNTIPCPVVTWHSYLTRGVLSKGVAIKRFIGIFGHNNSIHLQEMQRFYREIFCLRMVRSHPNIVKLVDIIYRPLKGRWGGPAAPTCECEIVRVEEALRNFQGDMYLVFEQLDQNLKTCCSQKVLRWHDIREITYQILKGIKYIHSLGIEHRDLKPANILISRESGQKVVAKIADMGLSRVSPAEFQMRTTQVVTPGYTAPEVANRNNHNYDNRIDYFSIGCILSDMAGSLEPFTPSIKFQRPKGGLFPTMAAWESRISEQALERAFPTAAAQCPECLDLIRSLVRYRREDRPGMEEALAHPFIAPVRAPASETSASQGLDGLHAAQREAALDVLVANIMAEMSHYPANF